MLFGFLLVISFSHYQFHKFSSFPNDVDDIVGNTWISGSRRVPSADHFLNNSPVDDRANGHQPQTPPASLNIIHVRKEASPRRSVALSAAEDTSSLATSAGFSHPHWFPQHLRSECRRLSSSKALCALTWLTSRFIVQQTDHHGQMIENPKNPMSPNITGTLSGQTKSHMGASTVSSPHGGELYKSLVDLCSSSSTPQLPYQAIILSSSTTSLVPASCRRSSFCPGP